MKETNQNIDEDEIVSHLQNGGAKAIGLLYDRYSAALYGVIFRIVRSERFAEDALQESFIKIWKNIDNFDKQKASLFTWMLNIARNHAIDVTRSKMFKQSMRNQEIETTPVTKTGDNINEITIGVMDFVANLENKYQEVIDLCYFQGYTQVEIAEKLDIPLGTVKSRIRIGLRELRKLLS